MASPSPAEIGLRTRGPTWRVFRAGSGTGEILAMNERAGFDVEFLVPEAESVSTRWTEDGIAIINIRGPLEQHAACGWDSYADILARVEAAMAGGETEGARNKNDSSDKQAPEGDRQGARAVVLDIDSPGGLASGSMYIHRKLRQLRARYNCPLYAYANETANSAAYAIASAADELWLPDTGVVGSIGVIATMFDRTSQNNKVGIKAQLVTSGAHKADGHADRPLTDDIIKRMQVRVDAFAAVFFQVVANARDTTPDAIAALEADVFVGKRAVLVGVADGVATWDSFLRQVGRSLEYQETDPQLLDEDDDAPPPPPVNIKKNSKGNSP